MGLAPDIGLGCLALVVEGVEILFEPGVGGDAGVDRAAEPLLAPVDRHGAAPMSGSAVIASLVGSGRHARWSVAALPFQPSDHRAPFSVLAPPFPHGRPPERSPKKRWPFQLVPVIALATIDRLP